VEGRVKRMERDEVRRAFGILTLLFYSLYTLNVRERDLLNYLSDEMDENEELAKINLAATYTATRRHL